MCTLACYTVSVVGVILLLKYFTSWDDCIKNKLFISINAALCIMLSVVSALKCCGSSKLSPHQLPHAVGRVFIALLFAIGCRGDTFFAHVPSANVHSECLHCLSDVDGAVECAERARRIAAESDGTKSR